MSISAGVSKRNGFIFTVGQEIPRLLWNPKAHYPVHKRPPLVPILSLINSFHIFASCLLNIHLILSSHLRGCIQKLPDWPPGARTANGKALRHWAQLYRYFVSRSSEFCHHNSLCCFSTSLYCCKRIFRYDSVRKIWTHPRMFMIHELFKYSDLYVTK